MYCGPPAPIVRKEIIRSPPDIITRMLLYKPAGEHQGVGPAYYWMVGMDIDRENGVAEDNSKIFYRVNERASPRPDAPISMVDVVHVVHHKRGGVQTSMVPEH